MEPLQLWSQPQESDYKFAGDLPNLLCLWMEENQGLYLLINAGYANKRRLNETLSDQNSVLCVPKGARESYVQHSLENKNGCKAELGLLGFADLSAIKNFGFCIDSKIFYIYLPWSCIVLFLIMTYALGRINIGQGKLLAEI